MPKGDLWPPHVHREKLMVGALKESVGMGDIGKTGVGDEDGGEDSILGHFPTKSILRVKSEGAMCTVLPSFLE